MAAVRQRAPGSGRAGGAARAGAVLTAALALLALSAAAAGEAPRSAAETLAPKILARVLALESEKRLVCRGELVCGIAELPRFYSRRAHRPAWLTEAGAPGPAATELLAALGEASSHGLRPQDYHLEALARLAPPQAGPLDPDRAADLDVLLTDAFLLLASHLLSGRVDPETLHAEWSPEVDPAADLSGRLEAALASGGVRETLRALAPPHPGYAALRERLAELRALAGRGGWEPLPEKAAWKPGDGGEIAAVLRRRLAAAGELTAGEEAGGDEALASAVARFQERHGLEPHGRLDPPTLAALNVPIERRLRTIELNLERWRWLPRTLGSPHLWVNVPDYRLSVVAEERELLGMRVVVGRHYRRTPVFSSRMEYLVLNPEWNIPRRIAVEDILPKIRRDPGYVARERIRVYESWGPGASEIDPAQVDWAQVTAQNFRFKLQKEPGPKNDLGRIKFMFPNKYAVYLHDTNSRGLFERRARGFSSGCIRIEKPLELAEFVLSGSPGWDREALAAAIASGHQRRVPLPERIPVHLVYFTAWVDREGRLQFRPDIYQRDPVLERALESRPPRP